MLIFPVQRGASPDPLEEVIIFFSLTQTSNNSEHLSNLTLTQSEKVIIFRDKQTDRHFSKNVTDTFSRFTRGGGRGVNKQKRKSLLGVPTDILDV